MFYVRNISLSHHVLCFCILLATIYEYYVSLSSSFGCCFNCIKFAVNNILLTYLLTEIINQIQQAFLMFYENTIPFASIWKRRKLW